ncbi:unnamed protein product [Rhodiola kirilowii]
MAMKKNIFQHWWFLQWSRFGLDLVLLTREKGGRWWRWAACGASKVVLEIFSIIICAVPVILVLLF